jgi:hypothetical protein
VVGSVFRLGPILYLLAWASFCSAQVDPIEHLDHIADLRIVMETVHGMGSGGSIIDLRGEGESTYTVRPFKLGMPENEGERHIVHLSSGDLLELLNRIISSRFFDLPDGRIDQYTFQLEQNGAVSATKSAVVDSGTCTMTVYLGDYSKSVEFSRAAGMSPPWLIALSQVVEFFAERRIEQEAGVEGD